jgi:hypothetical protein
MACRFGRPFAFMAGIKSVQNDRLAAQPINGAAANSSEAGGFLPCLPDAS